MIVQFTSLLWQQIIETNFIQWIAVTFAVAEVLLAKQNNILLYPAGIIATVITTVILFQAGLYAESLLNLYYFIMSIYGWWYWTKKKDTPQIQISRTTPREWRTVFLIVITSFASLSLILKNFTPSTVPYMNTWLITALRNVSWKLRLIKVFARMRHTRIL